MKKALLFITFNRLDYVKETFEQIKIAKPPRFYIASDGPREHVEGEDKIVQSVRDYILQNIDWECEVKTRFLDKNSGGCAYGVSGAVTWFFENEADGIILEDDCVPSQSFFEYCEVLLDKYKNNKKIWHIAGDCTCPILQIKESYYFAKIQHCWGWASWADRWKYHKLDLTDFNKNDLKKLSKNKEVQKYWENILVMMQKNPGYTWDYQWALIIASKNGYCINPTKNLIKNIGITGEHYTKDTPDLGKPLCNLDKIVHPKVIKYNWKAINYIYQNSFGINIKQINKQKYKHWYNFIFQSRNDRNHKALTILGIQIKLKLKRDYVK